MQWLQDRVAVVTHSATDSGRAIYVALQAAGARVLTDDGGAPKARPAALIERAVAQWNRVDILVNAHVVTPSAPAETLDVQAFKHDVAANLDAIFFACQAAAQQMSSQSPMGGFIINVSSVGGVVALPGHAAFCAAMAGVNAITKVLAVEWQAYGIRVVSVGAGLEREMIESLQVHPTLPDGRTPAHHRAPAHTLTLASDVADAVVYLASDAARHINGTTVYVDGGWLADGYWE